MGNVLSIKSNQCLVFKTSHYLKLGSIESDILILTPRHRFNDFSDLPNGLVVVSGSILFKEYNEELCEKELQENAIFVIVGSIRKVQ